MEKYPISSRDLKTTIVNIDSRFRDGLVEKSTSTNFFHRFEHPYKNCIRMRVLTTEIPVQGIPVISSMKQNNSFYLKAYDNNSILQTILVTIPDALYLSEQSIIDAIQIQFNKIAKEYGIYMFINLIPVTNLVSIYTEGSLPLPVPEAYPDPLNPQPFTLDFSTLAFRLRHADWGLGYVLGFRNKIIDVNSPIVNDRNVTVSQCPINMAGDPYIFLVLDDNYDVEHWTQQTLIQATAKIVIGTPRGAVNAGNGMQFSLNDYTILMNDIVFPNPTDIARIHCQLVDMYGSMIYMPCNEFSFSIELTQITNNKLYEKYRNHPFDKT